MKKYFFTLFIFILFLVPSLFYFFPSTFSQQSELAAISFRLSSLKTLFESLFSSSSAQTVSAPTNGLVGYWNFDEGSGTAANDSSGNSNTGTLTNNPTWTQGKVGGAILFDGLDDYVDVGTRSSLNLSGEVTISAWVKDIKTSGASRSILGDTSNAGAAAQYLLSRDNSNVPKIAVQWGNTAGKPGVVTKSNTGMTKDVFYHVVMIRQGSAGAWTGSVYINGVLDASTATSTDPSVQNRFAIGRKGGSSSEYWNGVIDEVRIYNRALSTDEVQALYTADSSSATPVPTATASPTPAPTTTTTTTPVPTATASPTPVPTATTSSLPGSFVSGDRIILLATTEVRAVPTTASTYVFSSAGATHNTVLATLAGGAKGSIIGGPKVVNGFTWWNVDYGLLQQTKKTIGWSMEGELQKTTPDTTAPTTPAGFKAISVASTQINLSWTASSDDVEVIQYEIFRNGTSIITTASTNWQDSVLPGTSYVYTIRAVDLAGNTSSISAPVSVTSLSLVNNPIDSLQAGHWLQIPSTHLRDVAFVWPKGIPTGSGISGLIQAWNGGGYDTKRDRLVLWGGGHVD